MIAIDMTLKENRLSHLIISQKKGNDSTTEYYDWNFEGDKYLLTKRFSILPPEPVACIRVLSHIGCPYARQMAIRIVPDTIHGHLSYVCKRDDDDDFYFEKVEIRLRYPKGLKQLDTAIQAKLQGKKIVDSAVLFTAIAGGDSSLHAVSLPEGTDKQLVDAVKEVLELSGPWLPIIQDGRRLKSYAQLFIRITPEGLVRLHVRGINEN